jgi:ferredoxin
VRCRCRSDRSASSTCVRPAAGRGRLPTPCRKWLRCWRPPVCRTPNRFPWCATKVRGGCSSSVRCPRRKRWPIGCVTCGRSRCWQPGGDGGQNRRDPVLAGRVLSLTGWLGQFTLRWAEDNPIALDLCTRCNACIAACPEDAIGLDYQIDLARCRSHRDCVRVCEAPGAIDFQREPEPQEATFDAVLDLRPAPAFTQHAPSRRATCTCRPRWGPSSAWSACGGCATRLALSRSPSFSATSSACVRTHATKKWVAARAWRCARPAPCAATWRTTVIVVEPHLCVGCGACTTVCPTGALTYAYPDATYQGRVFKTLLSTFRAAGGRDAVLLLHSQTAGQRLIEAWGRAAQLDRDVHGVPARVIPWGAVAHRKRRAGVVVDRHRLRRQPGLGVADRRGSAPIPRGAASPNGRGGSHLARLGLRGRALPPVAGARCARYRHARPSGSGAGGAWRRSAGQLRGASRQAGHAGSWRWST